jgi:hypothetical protein
MEMVKYLFVDTDVWIHIIFRFTVFLNDFLGGIGCFAQRRPQINNFKSLTVENEGEYILW